MASAHHGRRARDQPRPRVGARTRPAVGLSPDADRERACRARRRLTPPRGRGAAVRVLRGGVTELFEQQFDALLPPATFGPAPAGLESTGDPAFCSVWTLLGVPTLSMPLMRGANGLPLGGQCVGTREGDGRLLRTGRWLMERLTRD